MGHVYVYMSMNINNFQFINGRLSENGIENGQSDTQRSVCAEEFYITDDFIRKLLICILVCIIRIFYRKLKKYPTSSTSCWAWASLSWLGQVYYWIAWMTIMNASSWVIVYEKLVSPLDKGWLEELTTHLTTCNMVCIIRLILITKTWRRTCITRWSQLLNVDKINTFVCRWMSCAMMAQIGVSSISNPGHTKTTIDAYYQISIIRQIPNLKYLWSHLAIGFVHCIGARCYFENGAARLILEVWHSTTICKLVYLIPALHQSDYQITN